MGELFQLVCDKCKLTHSFTAGDGKDSMKRFIREHIRHNWAGLHLELEEHPSPRPSDHYTESPTCDCG